MFRFPFGTVQELNLDWFLEQWEIFKVQAREAFEGIDHALDDEIDRVEAAMTDLYAARDAAIAAKNAAETAEGSTLGYAQSAANSAASAAGSAAGSATSASSSAGSAEQAAQSAQTSAQQASSAATSAGNAATSASNASSSAATAANNAGIAGNYSQESAAWATGSYTGDPSLYPVPSTAPQHNNNAKYYAESITGDAASAAASASDAADSATAAAASAASVGASAAQIAQNASDIADLQTDMTAAESAITDLQTDLDSAESDIAGLQTDMTAALGDISTLQTDLDTAESDIADLQTDMTAALGDISTLQTDLDTAESDIADLQTDMTAAQGDVGDLKNAIDLLNDVIINGNEIPLSKFFEFERGGIGTRGQNVAGDYRIRTVDTITLAYNITLTAPSDYRFGVHTYIEGVHEDSGWIRNTSYTITKGTPFRIVISHSPEDTSVTADISTYANAIKLQIYLINSIDALFENINGTGNATYFGDKIVIADDSNTRKCAIDLWASYKTSVLGDLSAYDLPHVQSMAMHNGKVFLFSSSGVCTIIDYSTKAIEAYCTFTPSSRQHANSAQFSNIYYDASDDFPLLFLSRCGNAVTVVQPSDDACLIYRITVSNGAYTMTQVNSIVPSFTTYGISSWTIDNNAKKLYLATYANGTYQVSENNPIHIMVCNLPSETNIASGEAITISTSDIIAEMFYTHEVLQGAFCNGGLVYSGISHNQQYIWVFDVWANRVTSKIPLVAAQEVEGVTLYNGKIYATQRNGSGTDDEKLAIYELSF